MAACKQAADAYGRVAAACRRQDSPDRGQEDGFGNPPIFMTSRSRNSGNRARIRGIGGVQSHDNLLLPAHNLFEQMPALLV